MGCDNVWTAAPLPCKAGGELDCYGESGDKEDHNTITGNFDRQQRRQQQRQSLALRPYPGALASS